MGSIRRFLMVAVSVVLTAAFLLAMTASYFEARHEVDELFDAELAQTARLLKSSFKRVGQNHAALEQQPDTVATPPVAPPEVDSDLERTLYGHRYERKVLFQVRKEEVVLFESDESMLRLNQAPAQGYTTVRVDGYLWYLFTLKEGPYRFTAGERADIRDELAEEILASYMIPLLVSLPVLLCLLLWILKHGLEPLRELAGNIRSRGKDNLTPIQMQSVPEEIQPVVQALNHLFDQVRRSIEMERRFTAMASHEMRTPVSVLKVNVQNALNAGSSAECEHYLQELNQGIDRASRLMEQLLTLSKLEQTELPYEPLAVDLVPLLREEIAALYPLADARQVQLELHCDRQHITVQSVPQLLSVVVKNLIENAIKYSPVGGQVKVTARQADEQIVLMVEDSGPGVPESERQRIFNRFYRLTGTDVPGAGLGLAIVKLIVDILGARIELADSEALGGLCVMLRLSLGLPLNLGPLRGQA